MSTGRFSRARPPRRKRCRAITLTELLVTIGVIAVLMTLLVPAVAYGRSLARDASCKSQLSRLWIATTYYTNSYNGYLFVNRKPPLRISNVIYKKRRPTGWGALYPIHLKNYHILFCPNDPGRGPAWEYGWSNWGSHNAEVQCSYGYRGRQGIVDDADEPLRLGLIERSPRKVIGCDFYEPFFGPPRVHHRGHINILRCSGQVEQVDRIVSFGPTEQDFQAALDVLDQ